MRDKEKFKYYGVHSFSTNKLLSEFHDSFQYKYLCKRNPSKWGKIER